MLKRYWSHLAYINEASLFWLCWSEASSLTHFSKSFLKGLVRRHEFFMFGHSFNVCYLSLSSLLQGRRCIDLKIGTWPNNFWKRNIITTCCCALLIFRGVQSIFGYLFPGFRIQIQSDNCFFFYSFAVNTSINVMTPKDPSVTQIGGHELCISSNYSLRYN